MPRTELSVGLLSAGSQGSHIQQGRLCAPVNYEWDPWKCTVATPLVVLQQLLLINPIPSLGWSFLILLENCTGYIRDLKSGCTRAPPEEVWKIPVLESRPRILI